MIVFYEAEIEPKVSCVTIPRSQLRLTKYTLFALQCSGSISDDTEQWGFRVDKVNQSERTNASFVSS